MWNSCAYHIHEVVHTDEDVDPGESRRGEAKPELVENTSMRDQSQAEAEKGYLEAEDLDLTTFGLRS